MRFTPRTARHALARLLTVLLLACGLAAPGRADAAAPVLTVDLSATTGPVTGAGAGFLYGLSQDGRGPADHLLAPLAPTSARGGGARLDGHGWVGDGYAAGNGYRVRIDSALSQARRLRTAPYSAAYHLLVSDVWGADTTQPGSTVYPCAGGDCANWLAFLGRVTADVRASGQTVMFDIWNEPAGAFFPPGFGTVQYFQMWDTAVREIRRLLPGAAIVGPSQAGFYPGDIATFLGHVKAAGTVPDVLNWHFSTDPAADAQTARNSLAAAGISGVRLSMNEYLFSPQQRAGVQAWHLARIARSGLVTADHAIWTDCCVAGTLDSTLVPVGGTLRPTGQWWVYKAYAELTGRLATVTGGAGSVDAVAAADQARARAGILVGDSSGNTGPVTLALTGLGATPWLSGPQGVRVVVQRIPDQNPLAQPVVVGSQTLPPGTTSAQVPVTWQAANDAYYVTLTPATTASATVDGAATAAGPHQFTYGAGWSQTSGVADMYAGTANWSHTAGSTALLRFTGGQVALRAVRDTDQGRMLVSVDGSVPVTVDDYAPARNASAVVWTSPVLDPGPHVVVITVAPDRNPASTGQNIALDRADVGQPQVTRVDANATTGTHFTYGSGWGVTTGVPDMYAGTANWSFTAGSVARLAFTGTRVALHAVKDADQAIMTVAVDGGAPVQVDDYAPVRNASGVVWTSAVLAAGAHTLTVTVTGARDPASTGGNIALDSADIYP
ncbi:hypothetical protein [Sphaerisporangium corydalis]|uniref:Beta-xylosidase n=1 Tax=Sphaerisporangium corydalis TaxID=1441875 RepID=A0ABV9EEH8_9ACTN|nr:hypothetical protein [Sphaerisporangium corydalis]